MKYAELHISLKTIYEKVTEIAKKGGQFNIIICFS